MKKEKATNETTLVVAKPELPAILEGEVKSVEATVVQAEKWIELQNRVRIASLRMTLPEQWIDQNGRPYLEIGGAERIAQGWGISIINSETSEPKWREDSKGLKYYEITATVKAHYRGREYTQEGSATSKDNFFAKASGRQKDECEIDISDIRKKALTNAMNRVIKSIIGISHVTWGELESIGIKKGKIRSITYNTAAPEVKEVKAKEPVKDKELPKGENWFTSEYKGKLYLITYNENSNLTHNQMIAHGFKYNEEKTTYSREYADELVKILNDNYIQPEGEVKE